MKLNIPVLFGTSRENNQSHKAANFVLKQAQEFGFDSMLYKPEDILTAPATKRLSDYKEENIWSKAMDKADGLIIVSPEYNHGYPGELKMILDQLYDQYAKKPVAIIGASGKLGGGRMVEQLRQVVIELHMVPVSEGAYFDKIWEDLNNGKPNDDHAYESLKHVFTELKWYAEVLKEAKSKIQSTK